MKFILVFVQHYSTCINIVDLLLAKHTYCAINKLAQSGEGIRLPNNHRLSNQILQTLTSNFRNLETGQWIPLCEQGLNAAYQLLEQPILFSEVLLRDLSKMLPKFNGEIIHFCCCAFYKVFIKDGVSAIVLSRLLFCAGHVAQCQVVYCELGIIKERKKWLLNQNPNDAATKVSGTHPVI